MSDESIEYKYEKAFRQAAATHPVFPAAARHEMAQMVQVIAKSHSNLDTIQATNQSVPVKGGFAAEEFHAETFNLDAIAKNDNARAYTDRYDEWSQHTFNGSPLKTNDKPDIIVSRNGRVSKSAQSKYNYSAEETTSQMSQTKDGAPKYKDVDQLIGPSDQINPQNGEVSVREHAEAAAHGNKARGGDPAQTKAYKQTAQKSSDTLQDDKTSSRALSKEEANNIGAGDRSKLKKIESEYQIDSTLRHAGRAASNAAAMSAVVSGSINTVRYLQMAREGELTAEEATYRIIGETVAAAADSAAKAGANAGVQSLMVRYGSEKAALQVLSRQGLQAMLKTNTVTVGVACAVDAVKDLVKLGTGEISSQEFFDRQGKGLVTTSSGAVGGALGYAGATSLGTAIGLTTGGAVLGIAGGLAGGMIAGLAMTLALENGIEKPYRDLVQNTSLLNEAAFELERVSRMAFKSQVYFHQYITADLYLEKKLLSQMDAVDAAGTRALDAINKI